MRLLVLGLNWIASPQSLIDICMPQFIMISNEKIMHWGYPIANSICEVRGALSGLCRSHGGWEGTMACDDKHTWSHIQDSVDTEESVLVRVWLLILLYTLYQLMFTISAAVVVYLLCAIKASTRNKLLPCEPKLSKHLPETEVRGLKRA